MSGTSIIAQIFVPLTCLLLKEPLWKHLFMDFTRTNIVSFVQL